jgi:hypothetical protein
VHQNRREEFVLLGVTRVPAVLHSVLTPRLMSPSVHAGGVERSEVSSRGLLFIRCRITDDPQGLPDGAYRVEFANHRVVTNKFGATGNCPSFGRRPSSSSPTTCEAKARPSSSEPDYLETVAKEPQICLHAVHDVLQIQGLDCGHRFLTQ